MRAYSVLQVKSVDEAQRIIEGIATTPKTDRMEDIVEPAGAQFAIPIPFLWQHRSSEPIGNVIAAEVTEEGIPVRVQLAQTDEPGELKNLLDRAWQSIKLNLVRGLSIGFRILESSDIRGTFGLRITKWEWLELSAVTIPANIEATIQTVKSHDTGAASGASPSPGASGQPVKSLPRKPGARAMPQTISDQIKDYEATRAAKDARMAEIMEAANKAGTTLDAAQEEEHDTLETEVEAVAKHLVRLRKQEVRNKAAAVPVAGKSIEDADKARVGIAVVKGPPDLPPGVRFARVVKTLWNSRMQYRSPADIAAEMYPDDGLVSKAAVAAGSSGSGNWAANLVGAETGVFADFVEFLRPQTILGRFGQGGIPALRTVPFRTPLISQTDGGKGYWVGEGKPKPITKFNFARTTLDELKVANIVVSTDELLRKSSPSADALFRDGLAGALRERLDTDFVNPIKADDPGVSPASITNLITPITSSGSDADGVRADIGALFETFIAANNAPTSGVYLMPSTTALRLALMMNPLGNPEFPGMGINGGTLLGLPVIASEYVPTDSDGAIVVLVNASDIYVGDEGGISVDFSREASLQMLDDSVAGAGAPTVSSVGPTATSLVSLWQTNSVAFKAERIINWARRRASAVAVLDQVTWGVPA